MSNVVVTNIIDQFLRTTTTSSACSAINAAERSLPYNLGTGVSGYVTPNIDNGSVQYCDFGGDVTFNEPTGLPIECLSELTVIIRWSNGNSLNFASNIKRASDSAATFPKALTSYRSYIFKLKFMGGYWCLISLVGGFVENVS